MGNRPDLSVGTVARIKPKGVAGRVVGARNVYRLRAA